MAPTTRRSSPSFMNTLSPSAMFELEEHDDALTSICENATSSTFSSATSLTPTERTSSSSTHSTHTVSSTTSTVCSFDRNELRQLGHMGTGTYCKVDMVAHDANRSEKLAKKSIDPARVRCHQDLTTATTELANEAKMLSALAHENIIKLRGVSNERFSESFVSGNGGYFLIMDVLDETLRDRLDTFMMKEKRDTNVMQKTRSTISKRFRRSSSSSDKNLQECQRLYNRIDETVLGIARGMKYLHSKNIVLRDLKPDNIGFEDCCFGQDDDDNLVGSTVKLFDFGMAQKVEDCDPDEICGSPRYMAPEVMARKGYTTAVDVYSFGVILYEMCSLKRPFEESFRRRKNRNRRQRSKSNSKTNMIQEFYNAVVEDQIKPSENLEKDVCCPKLRALIQACWDHDPSKRPTFEQILSALVEIFFSDLFASHDSEYFDHLKSRDETGRRSVSIEFECSFGDLSTSFHSESGYSYP